jgi:hypothetical protein
MIGVLVSCVCGSFVTLLDTHFFSLLFFLPFFSLTFLHFLRFLPFSLNQGHALAVLASLSDNYAMRWVIFKEDWMGPTVVALNGNQVDG